MAAEGEADLRLTVLLIEDNAADADLIGELLDDVAAEGDPDAPAFDLVHVALLARGEERLSAGDVAVVLLDLFLPDSHGADTIQRVVTRFPDLPIIVMSGLDDELLAARAVRGGAQDYLVKGHVSADGLVQSLRYAIARKRAEADTARLLRERIEVEAALRARDAVLTTISHDLKTPLTAIKGHAQFLRRQVAQGQPPTDAEFIDQLKRIETTATRMTQLIDDLLDVTRQEAGQPPDLRREPTDLAALAMRTLSDFQHVAKLHQLCLDSSEQELIGRWDVSRLSRVLNNLLENALKFSPDGGEVRLTLSREAGQPADWAILRVQDTGLGIPPDEVSHVFERYYRARNVVERIHGTGIGLASARHIVEQHGGTIAVESREGVGSIFTVRLPTEG